MEDHKFRCMECEKLFDRQYLHWVNDMYGIPYKNVCEHCYAKVSQQISRNNYGKELTHDELDGEDY